MTVISTLSPPSRCVQPDWGTFARDFWEKKPTLFKDPGTQLCDPASTFDAICEAAEQVRKGRIRDYRDVSLFWGDSVKTDAGPYLPKRTDKTLDNYIARLEGLAGHEHFGLLFNYYEQFSETLSRRMREFAAHLYETLGVISAGHAKADLMIGRYPSSPFGVHKDPNSVFTFIVRGVKTMRVWPFEMLASHRDIPFARHRQLNLYDFDYSPFKESGTALLGLPGEILYWPSSYWHVGEGDGATHVSLHITFDVHCEPRGEAVDILQRIVEETTSEGPNDWHTSYRIGSPWKGGRIETPAPLLSAIESFRIAMTSTIPEAVKALWLGRMSAQGFYKVPESKQGTVSRIVPVSEIVPDPVFPIFWSVCDDSALLAANGRVIRVPLRKWTMRLLEAINQKQTFRPTDIASDDAVGEVQELLTTLFAMQAVAVLPAPMEGL